jgi:hypothetical protein
VGAGGSQEASYDLQTSVPAGTYHVVLDGIVIHPVDVQFDLLWRHAGSDTTLATWQLHLDPTAGSGFDAQAAEVDEQAPAIDFHAGDQLVFRYTGSTASPPESYIPDGDGAKKNGRDPNITLPR